MSVIIIIGLLGFLAYCVYSIPKCNHCGSRIYDLEYKQVIKNGTKYNAHIDCLEGMRAGLREEG